MQTRTFSCLEDLDKAARAYRHEELSGKTVTTIKKSLNRLYQHAFEANQSPECAYIYLVRYLEIYKLCSRIQDEKFYEVYYSKDRAHVQSQLEILRKQLQHRYSLNKKPKVEGVPGAAKPSKEPSTKERLKIFTKSFVTCQELYKALSEKHNILLVDARPPDEFNKSKIEMGKSININVEIAAGSSANSIELNLSSDIQKIWNERDKFDVLVLLDWNSTEATIIGTKLHKLKLSVTEWDCNKNYNEKPVILSGGYQEWSQLYPTMCTDPKVFIYKLNNELDELLDLDDIEYPSEEPQAPIPPTEPETEPRTEPQPETVTPNFSQRNQNLVARQEDIRRLLKIKEKKLEDLTTDINADPREVLQVEDTIGNLSNELDCIGNELNTLYEELHRVQFENDKKAGEPKDLVSNLNETKIDDNEVRDVISKMRNNALAEAKANKPKITNTTNNLYIDKSGADKEVSPTKTPTINRSTKPQNLINRTGTFITGISNGLIGLINIRNTCYMNTVVQCIRTLPALIEIFQAYEKHRKRRPDLLLSETASLVKLLWTSDERSLESYSFYDRVCTLEGTFKLGNHEDCMEFFLFLLNHLSDDCAYEITADSGCYSQLSRELYSQLNGKNSIFIELFYHHIRIKQLCRKCNCKSHKYEIESTFMLSVPDSDFDLQQLMEEYLEEYIIDDYCCSKCQSPVVNTKEIINSPKVLVIVLKRYKQINRNSAVNIYKIESKGSFPLNSLRFGKTTYSLQSVALHAGVMNSGHYTAVCLVNNKWYEFNDELVRSVNINDDSIKMKATAFFYSRN